MAMANMNLIAAFVTKLWPAQSLACGGGATKNIIPPKFSNFGDIIITALFCKQIYRYLPLYISYGTFKKKHPIF